MRVDIYRYTTLVDAKDAVIEHAALPEPQTEAMRLILGEELLPDDFNQLVRYAGKFKRVRVVLSRSCDWAWNLLSEFESLWGVQVHGLTKRSIPKLHEIPDTIRDLEIGINSGANSAIEELQRFARLERLCFTGKTQGIDQLTIFPNLRELSLHYVSEVDLNSLGTLKKLRDLKINHGSVRELPLANPIPLLRHLALWKPKRLNHISWISDAKQLESLEIGGLSEVTEIPDLAALHSLTTVVVDQLKSLSKISGFASAPALSTLHIKGMNHIDIEDYRAFVDHPTLSALTSGYSGRKKAAQVDEFIDLPNVEYEAAANCREF